MATKNLVIVESPAKAKTIEKYLGRNYKVVASLGHVRDLPKSQMGIDIEHDYEPRYISIRGKGDVIKGLKSAAKKADHIYLAADPDREGEAIAWHVSHLLNLSPEDNNRVVFNEITKDAVKNAFKTPRSIDMNLVDAQQARRILDRLVGYSISPILWAKVKKVHATAHDTFHLPLENSAMMGMVVTLVIRLAAIRWHLKLPTFALDDNGRS